MDVWLDNFTGGIGEIDFFENIGFVWMFELDNITEGIEELDYIDNIGLVLELTTGGMVNLHIFDNIEFV